MTFICKSQLECGTTENLILFEDFGNDIKWAQRNARSVPSIGGGKDVNYYTSVYQVYFGLPIDFSRPIKVFNPNQ